MLHLRGEVVHPGHREHFDFGWTEWLPLDGAWRGTLVPTTAGLYRIRRVGRDDLDYIGQTGAGTMNLRKRLAMLSGRLRLRDAVPGPAHGRPGALGSTPERSGAGRIHRVHRGLHAMEEGHGGRRHRAVPPRATAASRYFDCGMNSTMRPFGSRAGRMSPTSLNCPRMVTDVATSTYVSWPRSTACGQRRA